MTWKDAGNSSLAEVKKRNLHEWRRRSWACHIGIREAIERGTPLITLLNYSTKYHLTRSQIMGLLKKGELLGQKTRSGKILVTDDKPESWQGFL